MQNHTNTPYRMSQTFRPALDKLRRHVFESKKFNGAASIPRLLKPPLR